MYVSKKAHWNEQRVKALLSGKTRTGMPMAPEAVMGALLVTWQNQTADEQAQDVTRYQNGRGFSDRDADFGSSLVKQYEQWGRLSLKQWEHAQKMALRYWSQFAVALEAERAQGSTLVDPYTGEILDIDLRDTDGAHLPIETGSRNVDRFTWQAGDLQVVDDDNPFVGWDADEEPPDIVAEREDAERMQ